MSIVSMKTRREILDEESADTLSSMEMVGLARQLGGKYKETEAIIQQTLAHRDKMLGPEHPDTLANMNNLAVMLDNQGRHKEADSMHR
jgi:hypothetical protein